MYVRGVGIVLRGDVIVIPGVELILRLRVVLIWGLREWLFIKVCGHGYGNFNLARRVF
jgi:hypothetical protein